MYCKTILFETMADIKLTKEELIKAEVMVASRQLFKRFGYQKTTMEDIARSIGRGKSTLYYYYNSKEEIFEAILLKEAKEFFNAIAKKVEKASTAEEKMKAYVLTAYQVMSEKAVLNDVILNEIIKVDGANSIHPSMVEHIEVFNKKWFLIIRQILVFGVGNKEFSERVLDDVDTISFVLVSSLSSTVLMLAHYEDPRPEVSVMPVPEVLGSLVNILINGLKYK